MDLALLYSKLLVPLTRMVCFMVLGLIVANILEATHWVRFASRLAAPLARMGHLSEVCSASFSVAFFSPSTSNGLLAEAYHSGKLTKKELVLANLFNSSPTFLVHLPSLLFVTYAFIGRYAFLYVGLSLLAACLRTLFVLVGGRLLLPSRVHGYPPQTEPPKKHWKDILLLTTRRLKKRISKLLLFTVPTYCIVFALQEIGAFEKIKEFFVAHNSALAFLPPEALGIVALQLLSESGVALSAAASLVASSSVTYTHVVLALLVGNILSSPIRAIRHQFPSYAGFFSPPTALLLVVVSQTYRALSLAVVTAAYFLYV